MLVCGKNSFFREIHIKGKLKISCKRKFQLVVLYQVVTDPFCGLLVIFCAFISHLIGRKTINILEIFSGVHSFNEKTVTDLKIKLLNLGGLQMTNLEKKKNGLVLYFAKRNEMNKNVLK